MTDIYEAASRIVSRIHESACSAVGRPHFNVEAAHRVVREELDELLKEAEHERVTRGVQNVSVQYTRTREV